MKILRLFSYFVFAALLFLPNKLVPKQLAADPKSKPGMFVADVPGGPSKYFLDMGYAKVHFATDAIWFTAIKRDEPAKITDPIARFKISHKNHKGVNIKLTFPGANTSPTIEPLNKLASKANYLKGKDKSKWRSNLDTYDGVRYKNLYSGIDLEIRLVNGQLEPKFVLGTSANASLIKTKWEGAQGISLNNDASAIKFQTIIGDVFIPLFKISDSKGSLLQRQKPAIQGSEISSPFTSSQTKNGQSFPYASSNVNIVYIPGVDCNIAICKITKSNNGETYVDGITDGTTFQPTAGSFDTTFNGGNYDIFLVKLDKLGNVVYASYLGGQADEFTSGIFLDKNDNIYVAGWTGSSDFPTTTGAFDTICDTDGKCSHGDGFITKLNPQGSSLVFSTFIGGESTDEIFSFDVDSNNNVYATGQTISNSFPTTPGAYQRVNNGGTDVFAIELNSAGSSLIYGTYIGSSSEQYGYGIKVNNLGEVYISGTTQSGFPTTTGAFQTSYGGGVFDGFLTHLNSSGSALIYSTYIGGSDSDGGGSLSLDSSNLPIVVGTTLSSNFPTTAGAYRTTYNGTGKYDITVIKMNSQGNSLLYSTYLGGSNGSNTPYDIDLDASGKPSITGSTFAVDFPTTAGAVQTSYGGGVSDAFLSQINLSSKGANDLSYSTYLGNPSDDLAWSDKVNSATSVDLGGGSVPTGVSGALFDDPAKPAGQGYVAYFTLPSTVAQDIDSSIAYDSWSGTSDTNASGGTYRSSSLAKAKASFTFSGTDVTWVTKTGPDQGKALVLIDGVTKGTFNLKTSTTQWNVQKSFTGLSSGNHTITVSVNGGAPVAVDSFIVGGVTTEDDSPSVVYDNWTGVMQARADGGSYRTAKTASASASWTFTGSKVSWVTATGPAQGMAKVSIDGTVVAASEDLYTAKQTWKVIKSYTPSVSGTHTITITVLGTKNPASTGNNITVDGFQGFE